jgi:hypothetical protein
VVVVGGEPGIEQHRSMRGEMVLRKNLLNEASGSMKEAQRLIVEHLQQPEMRITSGNCDDVAELIAIRRKIEDLRCVLEVKASRNGVER